jgi:hypothetical protein
VFALALVPLAYLLQTMYPDMTNMPILVLIYLAAQYWVSLHNKERREYSQFLLPVSLFQMSLARLIILGFFCVIILAEYILISSIPTQGKLSYVIPETILAGIILTGYSIYFIIRDLLLQFFRRIGFTSQRMILVLVVAGIGFNLLGFYALLQVKQGNSPGIIENIIEFAIEHNPFSGDLGSIKFFGFSLLTAFLTLLSYSKRKSYLE